MTRWPVVAISLAAVGCSTLTEVNAGPVVALPTKEDPSIGGGVALHSALSGPDKEKNTLVGIDVNTKMKVTSETQHIAFGNGLLYARPVGRTGEVLFRTGLHLVFERFDEKLIVGGGPYTMLMGGVTLDESTYYVPGDMFAHTRRDRTLLTFGPMAEIDARFSRPSAVAFLGLGVGIAWASEVVETTEPPPPIFPPVPQKRPFP
jgi:hypothetical protein